MDGIDLRAELRATLDAAGLADSAWLGYDVGERPASGTWTTFDRLVAGGGAGLRLIVAATVARHAGFEERHAWRSSVTGVVWPVAELSAVLVRRARRLVRLSPDSVALGLRLDDARPGVARVWLRQIRLAVPAGDPLASAGHPDVEVVDDEATLLRLMVADLVQLVRPVVDAVRPHAGTGRRGLWGGVLDCLVYPFSEPAPGDAGADDQRRRVDTLLAACSGTPLDQRPTWVEFEHDGRTVATLRKTACCLAYEWPAELHPGRADGCDPTWDRYCFACPLIPEAETVHRSRSWLSNG